MDGLMGILHGFSARIGARRLKRHCRKHHDGSQYLLHFTQLLMIKEGLAAQGLGMSKLLGRPLARISELKEIIQ
jgi:hypothetical protein